MRSWNGRESTLNKLSERAFRGPFHIQPLSERKAVNLDYKPYLYFMNSKVGIFFASVTIAYLVSIEATAKCSGLTVNVRARVPDAAVYSGSWGFMSYNCPINFHEGDTLNVWNTLVEDMTCPGTWTMIFRNGELTDSVMSLTWQSHQLVITEPGEYHISSGFQNESGGITPSWLESHLWLSVIPAEPIPDVVRLGIHGLFLFGAMDMANPDHLSMTNGLSRQGLVPATQPYNSMGFSDVTEDQAMLALPYFISMVSPLVDWVRIELYGDQDLSDFASAGHFLLDRQGRLFSPRWTTDICFDAPPGEYYVRLVHRNHLPVAFGPVTLQYEPTWPYTSLEAWPVIGEDTRVELLNGRHALRCGNTHLDIGLQRISYAGANNDRDAILQRIGGTNPTATISGYFNEDVNMDGVVKYVGANNDRDLILQAIGGVNPIAVVNE